MLFGYESSYPPDATEQALPGSRLLLDAAFLVPVRRADAFRAALHQYARKLTASGIVASLTGPWPAYNFVEAPAPAGARRPAKARVRGAARASAPARTSSRGSKTASPAKRSGAAKARSVASKHARKR